MMMTDDWSSKAFHFFFFLHNSNRHTQQPLLIIPLRDETMHCPSIGINATLLLFSSCLRSHSRCISSAIQAQKSQLEQQEIYKCQPQPQPQPLPQTKKLSTRLTEVLDLCSTALSCRRAHQNNDKNLVEKLKSPSLAPITVADIGCDHAQLSVALIQNNVADRVLAVDRANSPLDLGKENAYNAGIDMGVGSKIEFRLGDGLAPLRPEDGLNAVCIAGVGARCIIDILESSYKFGSHLEIKNDDGERDQDDDDALRSLGVDHLILQPVSPHPQYMIPLRRWLEERRWSIRDETITKNGKRIYLTVLASNADSIFPDEVGTEDLTGQDSNVPLHVPKLNDEDLTLPYSLKRRIHSHLLNVSDPKSPLSSATKSEVDMWKAYVKEYRNWAESAARSDTYDRHVGVCRKRIAEILAKEEQRLQTIMS